MKNKLLIGILALTICSCSLLQRHDEEETAATTATEEGTAEAKAPPPLESEVARLNTKISALETKIDVLSSNMERMEMKKSQPVIEAEAPAPQPTMAAPVDMGESEMSTTQVSAAPVRPKELPAMTKSVSVKGTLEIEREFKLNMIAFQNGKNMEASRGFSQLAKKHPQHLLASHALYWAGESAARDQQWSVALDNWSELEKSYPRSAYIPEALAGMSRGYEKQGNISKAMSYRENLMRAFPKSPVAMNFVSSQKSPIKNAVSAPKEEEAPTYQEEQESKNTESE